MDASVVIATLHRAEWLGRNLARLERQTLLPREVLVVGRPSDTDATRVVAAAAERGVLTIQWLDEDRPGHVPPIRQGSLAAAGGIVVWLDDDGEPATDTWLADITAPLIADPRVACVGGPVLEDDLVRRVPRDAGNVRWYGRRIGNVAGRISGPVRAVASAPEGNCAWRGDVLKQLTFAVELERPYPVHYGLDLGLQAAALGYTVVFEPKAAINHRPAPRAAGAESTDRAARTFDYSHNLAFVVAKHLPRWRRIAFLAWASAVGERSMYGPVRAAVAARRDPEAVRLVPATWRGLRAGHRAGRRRCAAETGGGATS